MKAYDKEPIRIIKAKHKDVHVFSTDVENIDAKVVEAFGEEWVKFSNFDSKTISTITSEYFDILTEEMVNKDTYAIDIGCGTGRFTKYLCKHTKFVECVDPSKAIYAADILLAEEQNIRLTQASTESLPFPDETFDFAMSIGVLHHIPDTQKAMMDCVKKVKKGGFFYCYLYYNLDNRNPLYRFIFHASDLVRKVVSKLPKGIKKFVCDVLAIVLYMPWVLLVRMFKALGMPGIAKRIPLEAYANKSFFVIRNDSLDRFGTSLEQRFSKKEVIAMMEKCGLTNVVVGPNLPYYHAVGKKS